MVTSATTVGVSTVPAGGKFSPNLLDHVRYAYYVNGDGHVSYYDVDWGSCGRYKSPDLFGDSSKDGWRIASSGSAGSLGDHYVYDSYG